MRAWGQIRRFKRLRPSERRIVFYAEGPADWAHLGPVVRQIVRASGAEVCYLTSDAGDPVLALDEPGVRAFFIGSGSLRTMLFRDLDAAAVVMTMTDLDTFFLKRSVHRVHYCYVFHAIMSTHAAYRKGAFDAYDTVLCVGPHHVDEIRATEQLYALRPKRLIEHGSGRVDSLVALKQGAHATGPERGVPRVLVAPTWGPSSLAESCLDDVITALLAAGLPTTVRLHSMTVRERPGVAPALRRRFGSDMRFLVEGDDGSEASVIQADVMVSDWSGAALEFALGLERPVVLVDTPQKIRNPDATRIGRTAIEAMLRPELGVVVPISEIALLGERVLHAWRHSRPDRLRELRERWIFNPGSSALVAAREIVAVAEQSELAGA